MSLPARLQLDRRIGDRQPAAANATLRDLARWPHDVQVDDLSSSGCHIATLLVLPLDSIVTIGIPPIGIHALRVIRETEGGYGCAFERPLSDSEVRTALTAGPDALVAHPAFQHGLPEAPPGRRTPAGLIGVAIVASVAISWAVAGVLAHLFGII